MATQEDVPVLRRHPWHTPLHARSAHRPPIQTLPIAALNNEATSRRLVSGQLSSPPGGRQGLVGVKLFAHSIVALGTQKRISRVDFVAKRV